MSAFNFYGSGFRPCLDMTSLHIGLMNICNGICLCLVLDVSVSISLVLFVVYHHGL